MIKTTQALDVRLVYYTPPWLVGWMASASHGGKITDVDKDAAVELAQKLLKWRHMEPFEASLFVFDCRIPLYVASQLNRHRVGCGRTQQSLRYCNMQDAELYFPTAELSDAEKSMLSALSDYTEHVLSDAKSVKEKEHANRLLPANIMIRYRCYYNFRSFLHLLEMRDKEHVQPETRQVVRMMKESVMNTEWRPFIEDI